MNQAHSNPFPPRGGCFTSCSLSIRRIGSERTTLNKIRCSTQTIKYLLILLRPQITKSRARALSKTVSLEEELGKD